MEQLNLDFSFERNGVCGFANAGQDATTRNSYSIPGSCNVTMCLQNRAIRTEAETPTR